jgi:asparagine synthase (glutamine-hydrolysing)
MFAFAVWDRREAVLSLSRDRLGEKPLYYGRLPTGEVLFGSTLDALRAHPSFEPEVDRNALALYFRHKYVPAPWSIYSGVFKLEPGCTIAIDGRGAIGDPTPSRFDGSARDAVDELDRLLEVSVRRRLEADVPVGAFLSGGIDSSLVVAVAQRVSGIPVRTYTIGSGSADYDESNDARAVAQHLGTDHTELRVSEADALAVIGRIGSIWDEPFGDSSQVPTVLVSELARRDVTVALSGDGGDELFLGYNRYAWAPGVWNAISRAPHAVRRPATSALRAVPPGWWDRAAMVLPRRRRPRLLGLKVSKVAGVADANDPYDVYHRLVSHWQWPERLVPGAVEPLTLHTSPLRWPQGVDLVTHMAALDSVTYLPDDILTKVDRATMSVGLEGRVPLLDRSIVEFAARLPTELKLRGGVSKWPLRELLSRSVPAELFDRPKSGFGVPIEEWLRGPLRDWAESEINGPAVDALLDGEVVHDAWKRHQSGRQNLAYELWDVLMFCAWWTGRHSAGGPTG